MLPGPTLVKKCGECAGLFKQRTLTSGNTCGATYWTDGRMAAPMLPRTPALVRCPHCSAVLWAKGLEEADSFQTYLGFLIFEEDEAVREAYDPLPFYGIPEFGEFAGSAGLSPEDEFRARTQA